MTFFEQALFAVLGMIGAAAIVSGTVALWLLRKTTDDADSYDAMENEHDR